MSTLKQLSEKFHNEYEIVKKNNQNEPGVCHKPAPDWKYIVLPPIIKAIEKELNVKLKNEELRQFGLRAHVPLTFTKEGKDFIYLDVSNSLESGEIYITDYSAPSKNAYKPDTIGSLNGFNLQQICFKPTQTPKAVAKYVATNINKFLNED